MSETPLFDNAIVQQLFEDLVAAYQNQDHAAVQRFCVTILEHEPDNIDAHFIRGNYLAATGQPHQAIPHLEQTIAGAPERVDAILALANALIGVGNSARVREVLQSAVERHPTNHLIWCKLGNFYYDTGHDEHALKAFKKALALVPDHGESYRGAGLTLLRVGLPESALSFLQRAYAHDPSDMYAAGGLAEYYEMNKDDDHVIDILWPHRYRLRQDDDIIRLLVALASQNRVDDVEAIVAAHQETLLKSNQCRSKLTHIYCAFGMTDKAVRIWQDALANTPDDPECLFQLALTLQSIHNNDTAIRHLKAARDHTGENVDLLRKIGYAFARFGDAEEAIHTFRQVLKLAPDDVAISHELLQRELSVCDFDQYDGIVSRVRKELDEAIESGTCLPYNVFNLQALPLNYAELHRAATALSRWFRDDLCKVDQFQPFAQKPAKAPGKRIRLGYILPYTWFHSLPLVLNELIPLHDRSKFEVFGYCVQNCDGTDFSRGYRGQFDRFKDISFSRPRLSAEEIHQDKIDILIDVTGLTQTNNMHIMAFRPAQLQIHGFGYSITTGADYIDYLITDPVYIPPSQAHLNTEKLLYMPECFLPAGRYTHKTVAMDRRRAGLPDDAIVFTNFNEPYKFAPDLFAAWAEILNRVPESVLWLGSWSEKVAHNLKSWMQEHHQIDPKRLIFAELVPHARHLARLAQADIALDCFRHGGGVTTLDALWSGLPLITCAGNTPASRLGATMSGAIGMNDLVTNTPEAYVETAIALANDPLRREQISNHLISQRSSAPLFDIARFCRHFEDGLEAVYARYRDGLAPDHIRIEARKPEAAPDQLTKDQLTKLRGGAVPGTEKAFAASSGEP